VAHRIHGSRDHAGVTRDHAGDTGGTGFTEAVRDVRSLLGVLVQHKGHALVSDTRYKVQPGRVYGEPHVLLICQTDGQLIWDESVGDTE
jgi:hypothetical protein